MKDGKIKYVEHLGTRGPSKYLRLWKICPNITFLVFEHEVSQAASPGGKILTTCIHKPYVDMLQLYTYTGFVFGAKRKIEKNEICWGVNVKRDHEFYL